MPLTNEDLAAISQLLDTKLESALQPVKDDMQLMKDDMQLMKDDMQLVKDDMQLMKDDMQLMKQDITKINLTLENIVLPRLNTIEACYTDTYRRYQRDADKMEVAFDDIDLLKKTVSEHSEKLQRLA